MLKAINHEFSSDILARIGNLEYMISCKELWRLLTLDMGTMPVPGWKLARSYGTIYFLKESHSK